MRPRLAAPHRNARLGIAPLLGILLGLVLLAGLWFSGSIPSTIPAGARCPHCGYLRVASGTQSRAGQAASTFRPALLWAFGGILLVVAVLVVVMLLITASGAPANTAIAVVYLLGGPFIAAAAPAFTVGGLGGYAARWAGSAVWSGILAWVGMGVVILPVAYLLYISAPPCDSTKNFCIDLRPLIILIPLFLFGVGLVVAPLGGLAGGALRAWVGRNLRAD